MINVNIISALNSPVSQAKNMVLDFLIVSNENHKGTAGKGSKGERDREMLCVLYLHFLFGQSSCWEGKRAVLF